MKKRPRPENWPGLLCFGEALVKLGKTLDQFPHDENSQPDPKAILSELVTALRDIQAATVSAATVGSCLIAVARGNDAVEVFGQQKKGRGRQKSTWKITAVARVFWGHRANGESDEEAATATEKVFPELKSSTIVKYAQRQWKNSLRSLERSGKDVVALRKQCENGSKRGSWS